MSDRNGFEQGTEVRGPSRWACARCGHRFSSDDARFCPFDGEPLAPLPEVERDPRVGTVIGERYFVEAVIGEGGMGVVYRIRHRNLGKRFALKMMRADLASDGVVAARFVQEAQAMAAIHHPNIVAITDFGDHEGVPYFVMEHLEGESLADVLRREGALPIPRVLHIAGQIASALMTAHAAGIVHRDLKPDNVHVGPGDVVKVLDFGIAKLLGASRLTRTGMVFGTPHYISPEQAAGLSVDHRADIYSFGIVLYELLTGSVPFEADTFMGVLTKHLTAEPIPPSRVRADPALGQLEPIVLRCLQKAPDKRFASAAELLAALDAVGKPVAPPQRRGPAPQHLAIAMGVVALAALVLVVAFLRARPTRAVVSEPTPSPTTSSHSGSVARLSAPEAPATPPPAASVPAAASVPEPVPTPASPSSAAAPASSAAKPAKRPTIPPKPASPEPAEPRNLRTSEIIDPWAD